MSVSIDYIKEIGLPAWVPQDAPLQEVRERVVKGWGKLPDTPAFRTLLDRIIPHTIDATTYELDPGKPALQLTIVEFRFGVLALPNGSRIKVWFATAAHDWQERNPDAHIPGQPATLKHRSVFWFSE